MMKTSRFTLNGNAVDIATAEPSQSLLRWLNQKRLTGTKEGCGDGDCGACTVAMAIPDQHGKLQWQAINSCLMPMGAMAGREIRTVEGIGTPERMHPVQQAMVDAAGSQCGYCTPGFVMSLFVGFENDSLNAHTIEGNLCRCTGYRPIREAAQTLNAIPKASRASLEPTCNANDLHLLDAPSQHVQAKFLSPPTIEAALALKQANPAALWIAGATDLGVLLSRHQYTDRQFIALDRIAALQTITREEHGFRLGAGVTLTRLHDELHGAIPMIEQMLPWFAANQVQNRATVGGNIGSASPIGDLLPIFLALNATIRCVSAKGARDIPVDEYFLAYRTTALRADELIESVLVPDADPAKTGFYKIAKRQTDDISIVAAAFLIRMDGDVIQNARLAFGGVAATPIRAKQTESLLVGARWDESLLAQALTSLQNEFKPLDDHRASAEYRRALCGNLFKQFAREVLA